MRGVEWVVRTGGIRQKEKCHGIEGKEQTYKQKKGEGTYLVVTVLPSPNMSVVDRDADHVESGGELPIHGC